MNLSLANMVAMGIGVITIPMILSSLGAASYGSYVLVITFCLISSQIINTRSWEYILSVQNLNISKIANSIFLDSLAFISLIILIFFFSPVLFEYFNVSVESYLAICVIAATSQVNWPQGVLRLKEKILTLSLLTLVAPMLKLILILYFYIYRKLDLEILINIHAISELSKYIAFQIFAFKIVFKELAEQKFGLIGLLETLKHCLWLNLAPITDLPSREFDKVLTSMFFGQEFLAVYHITKKITSILSVVSMPIYQILYPMINEMYTKKKFESLKKSVVKLVLSLNAASLGAWIMFWISFEVVDSIAFDGILREYKNFILLYLFFFCISTSLSPVHPLFNVTGNYRKSFAICFLSNFLYLILVYSFQNTLGIYVMIFAFSIQFVSVIICKSIFIQRSLFQANVNTTS